MHNAPAAQPPSFAHRMSRVLLAVETIVLTAPVFAIAQLLTVFFVLWLFLDLGSMFFDPSPAKALMATVIALGALGCLLYLYNLAALSIAYVFQGRDALARLGPARRAVAFAGPLFSLGWALVVALSSRIGDNPVSATAMFFLPSLLLLPPALHLICAIVIADYHAGRARASLRRGGLWPR
jgi:hypothetical protein